VVQTSQPSTRKGIFLNLGLFQFLSFVRRGVFYTFMINYIFSLMKTVTFTALLGTLNMAASALGQNLLWGKICDRYKLSAKLVIAGEAIAAVTYFIVFLIHKSLIDAQADFNAGLSLIVGLSFLEFFWSMSDVGWAALLTNVTTTETRGKIVGTLNFVASLGRMIGISFAGYLYNNGAGFREGTIFYIVIAMLLTSTTIMLITSRTVGKTHLKADDTSSRTYVAEEPHPNEGSTRTYNWFLASLIVIIIGAACTSQVFLLFLKLPPEIGGLNATDPEVSLILTAFTIGGMATSLSCGWLADKIGRTKVLSIGFGLAITTPLVYGLALSVPTMAIVYGLNGVSFWTIQTVGFAFAADLIPENKRGRLFGRYNTVMALSWGPAGLLIGGPLADLQVQSGLSTYAAYINTFYASAAIVAIGTALFALRVANPKNKTTKS
jgi:MFS family permease